MHGKQIIVFGRLIITEKKQLEKIIITGNINGNI